MSQAIVGVDTYPSSGRHTDRTRMSTSSSKTSQPHSKTPDPAKSIRSWRREPTLQLAKEDSDEFENYAIAVEKHLHSEMKMTTMRLNFLQELRKSLDPLTHIIDITGLPLLNAEDTTDSDSLIMVSAIQDGNVTLVRQFLKELDPSRRNELLQSRISSKYGASYIQLALEFKDAEMFRELRLHMSLDMKKRLTLSRDNLENNALHDACLDNTLPLVQSLLSNFSKLERPECILSVNGRGNNCLRMAAANSNEEIFLFLLKQLDDKDLWNAVMMPNAGKTTMVHLISSSSTRATRVMFIALCDVAKRLKKVKEFLFQKRCPTTILHSLMTADSSDEEKETNVLKNLKLVLELADLIGQKRNLIWKYKSDNEGCTALYCLASFKEINKTSAKVCSQLLSHVDKSEQLDYIMVKETEYEQNSLHAVARQNNVHILQCLARHIPANKQMECFMVGSSTGSTPLHLAAIESVPTFTAILKLLTLEKRQQLILSTDSHGNTPVLIAFIEGNIDVVNSLMKEEWLYGRLIFPLMSARNHAGWTVIHLSCIRLTGDTLADSVLAFFVKLPGVNLPAMLNHVDVNGNTVLHLAALLYRPKVIEGVLNRLRKSEHRRYLLKKNKDQLVASQMCNMPDLVVVKYLQPLMELKWTSTALIAKRGDFQTKKETQIRLRDFERDNGISPTPIEDESCIGYPYELNEEWLSTSW